MSTSTIARDIHIAHDSHGISAIRNDIDQAGQIVAETRKQIEIATGQPVVSARHMIREPDGGLWGQLPPKSEATD